MRGRAHIELVDYLRGLAAAMVTWFHMTNGYGATWPAYTGSYGWLGVEIFFVISGFVITLTLTADKRPWRVASYLHFMTKRLIRLEPPYLVSVAMTVALLYLPAHLPGFQGQQPHVGAPQLLFHLAYLIPFTPYDWLQPVYWTLTYEFFFYLVGGMAIPLLMARQQSAAFVVVAVLVAVASGFDALPPLVLLFVIGIAACRWHVRRGPTWSNALVAIGAAGAMAFDGPALQASVGLVAGLVLANAAFIPPPPAPVARLLKGLGAISYSLYLVHVPVGGRLINLGSHWLHTPIEHFALSVLAFLACCAVATAFWWATERPSIAAADRYGRKVRAREAG